MRLFTMILIAVSCFLTVGCGENAKEPKPFEIDKILSLIKDSV